MVFYTWSQSESGLKYDPGFGKDIQWDLPLLDGYPYRFVENISGDPGSHHNKGIDNPSLIGEIKTWMPDAVMVYGWNFKSHLAAMRYFKGKIPVLFRGDSTLLGEKAGIKKILRRLYLRYIYSNADIALYAGEANKAYFLKHGFAEKDLVFMPHAIDNKRFEPTDATERRAGEIRDSLSIPKEAVVFLFAGKLDDNKRPAMPAKIFTSAELKNAFLLIAGSGKNEEELKNTFAKENNIRFLPFQNQQEMPALYAAADVFVLPSVNETWGLAVNEAMAAGKAVIVSDGCGAACDLVTPANGNVFRKNSEEELKNAVFRFAADKRIAAEAGKVSRQIISRYSYADDCPAVEKILTGSR